MDKTAQNTPLKKVADILAEKGYTDDQIADFMSDLTKTAFANLYTNAMSSLTEDDMKAIEASPTDEEAQTKIKKLYKMRTGLDPDEETQHYYKGFAEGFIKQYEEDKKRTTPS